MEDNEFEVLIIMSVISTIAFFVLKDIFKTHTHNLWTLCARYTYALEF